MRTQTSRRRSALTGVLLASGVIVLAACRPVPPPPPPPPPAPAAAGSHGIMGPSGTTAGQLALAFARLHPGGTNTTEPLGNIATYYIEEGNAAGVRGDIAFAQGILETGWFMYGGQVQPNQNNFAGIKNADGVGFASFGSARLGVRAQIQHLRRYADPAASCAPPANVDPRCSLVTPGIAPTWQQLDGKWAVPGTGYGNRIIGIYNDVRAAVGLPPI